MADVWLNERGRRERKTVLGKQRNSQEQLIREKNKMVSEQGIIPLNRKDNPPPVGAPTSDDEMSDDDSFAGSPHTEPEGDFFDDVAPATPPMPLPPEAPNIDPEGATVPPTDPSPEGANSSPEGAKTRNHIWTRDKDNHLKQLKLNRELYALTCGCHHKPPMAKKLSQNQKRLKYMNTDAG